MNISVLLSNRSEISAYKPSNVGSIILSGFNPPSASMATVETQNQSLTQSSTSNNTIASTLLDDNFDSENKGRGALNYSHFRNWFAIRGTVDLLGNGFSNVNLLPVQGLYVDLDGTSGTPGTLVSKKLLSFQPGKYILQFDLAGSQGGFPRNSKTPDTVKVSLGNLYQETFTIPWDNPVKTIIRHISVSQPTIARLIFEELTDHDNDGLLLDNVKIYKVQAS